METLEAIYTRRSIREYTSQTNPDLLKRYLIPGIAGGCFKRRRG